MFANIIKQLLMQGKFIDYHHCQDAGGEDHKPLAKPTQGF